MDLSNINLEKNAEQGADMELVHPVTGDVMLQDNGKPITIKVLGTDSKAYRNRQREYQRQRIAKIAKARNKAVDYTVSDEDACNLLSECTVCWDGIIVEGKKLEFSKDSANELYLKFNWIREQVDGFIGDRANFFRS